MENLPPLVRPFRGHAWLPVFVLVVAAATQLECGNSLTTSANPGTAGSPVTFTALVGGNPIPQGTVTFKDASSTLATVPLDGSGAAAYTTSTLTVGVHPITEQYSGDGINPPSSSNTIMQVVNPVPVGFSLGAPCRAIDTRQAAGPYGGPALGSGGDRNFVIAGRCGVPPTAIGVAVNITVTDATAPGDLRFTRGGGFPVPPTSAINYRVGQTRANNAIVWLGTGGDISVHCEQPSGVVQLVVDISGYFE